MMIYYCSQFNLTLNKLDTLKNTGINAKKTGVSVNISLELISSNQKKKKKKSKTSLIQD